MKQELETVIASVVQSEFGREVAIDLTRPDEQFGDYATNVALQLAKEVGKNPREIADILAVKIQENASETVAEVSVAGPGFLNIVLSDNALIRAAQVTPAKSLAGRVVLVEYSDPNPFKPLHAGHLYTTLVGDVIARLEEVAGANVTRINYGGDVGPHVARSMWSIIKFLGGENPEKLQEIAVADRPAWLGERYVEGNNAYEDDEAAKKEILAINKRVYELHAAGDHESKFAQIYWTCRDWSYEYFEQLYSQLEVHQFDRVIPESEVAELGASTVREQLKNGVYTESDGAIVFKGDDHGLHTRVFINSQGLPTYEAKDVGLLLTKWRDYNYDQSIYITANEQAQYMQVMFKSVEQFLPEAAKRARHLTHGLVKLQGGRKMSSRKGNIVAALDIIDAASEANKKATGQDNKDTVLGAIKYAFLKNRMGGDIIYDPQESVSLEGNSGPYLQYAHARARSILRKAEDDYLLPDALELGERSLVRKLSEYSEVVNKAVDELMPHHICTYLYELAQVFNRFYESNRVIGDPRQAERLELVKRYAETLRSGLELLGIPAPEKM